MFVVKEEDGIREGEGARGVEEVIRGRDMILPRASEELELFFKRKTPYEIA